MLQFFILDKKFNNIWVCKHTIDKKKIKWAKKISNEVICFVYLRLIALVEVEAVEDMAETVEGKVVGKVVAEVCTNKKLIKNWTN